jgi:hypothetical protein
MKILEPLFVNIIEKLIENNVDFLLIGGYAVNFHGYGRFTGDMDFWLRPDKENKRKLINALNALKKNTSVLEKLDFSHAQTISIGQPPLRIDFLTKVNLVDFDEAWEKRNFFQLNSKKVPVVDYDHLILTKFNTGRPQDKNDLEQLQKIHQTKGRK